MSVRPLPLPEEALLQTYARNGSYTDCYTAEIATPVSFERYVAAFYTTWVFKLERLILKWVIARPSTDEQAGRLASGAIEDFAAWRVEARATDQLLLSDIYGSTRSWLMVAPLGSGTRLYFGSAVVARSPSRDGRPRLGFRFRALLGFHRLYSRVLLHSARARLVRTPV